MNSASGVSIFQREILYAAYSVHANPFESDSAAEFGFKNLAIRPSSRTRDAWTVAAGCNFIACTGRQRGASREERIERRETVRDTRLFSRWKNAGSRNTRINGSRRLRTQIVSEAQSTYGRDRNAELRVRPMQRDIGEKQLATHRETERERERKRERVEEANWSRRIGIARATGTQRKRGRFCVTTRLVLFEAI